jgi:signal transduction histidine kinase/AraC-like DNA-binding protein
MYNGETDSFINFANDPNNVNSLKVNDVRVIYEDSRNNIWIGTNGGGLHMFDPINKKITAVPSSNESISPNDVRAIVEDKNGNLWVGAYGGGLNYFDVNKKKFYRRLQATEERNLLSNNVVLSLHLDEKEQLWIGTEGDGLIVYNTKNNNTRVFNESNGIANSTIYAIKEDRAGKVWVSTNKGLSQLDIVANIIYNFDESDGLQSGQFNEGAAIYNEKEMYMCFGGTEGWNIFYPEDVGKLSPYKPEIHITGLQLFGKKLDEGDNWNILNKDLSEKEEIILKPNQPVFSIHYVALNFTYPNEGEYAYKLEGLDKDWNYVKGQRSATYRYLDPGEYIFKVKASNQDQIWTNTYKSIKIRVLPPWYKTWWAYWIYFGLGLFIVSSYFRYKAKQARLKYKIKLAQIEAVKEKELNEKKHSFFTNISHEFRTPLTLILNPVKELLYNNGQNDNINSLNIVYRNTKRMLSLVDQLLLFSKKENEVDKLRVSRLNFTDLCKEVFLCFTYEAKAKNIQYDFIANDSPIELYGDREKVEIALYNLVSNALKFTPEYGKVSLQLSETNDAIIVIVKDTGKGISENIGEKLFERFYQVRNVNHQLKGGFGIGLYLVKSVVDNHKGTLKYVSKLGVGTTFKITFLKGTDHFNPALIFEDLPEKSVFLEEFFDYDENQLNSTTFSDGVNLLGDLSSETKTILVIDDNADIRQYILNIFKDQFTLLEANNGDQGLELINEYLPDLVISDVIMPGINGIELCRLIKEDSALNHIPIILLTASSSSEIKLKGIEQGADDYISKPFDKAILRARVIGILKSHNNLQSYFFNEITLKPNHVKISGENKEFLDRCMQIVENHIEDPEFGIKNLIEELGMSRSNLYNKIKSISGQSANSFIRFIRLRKAAELLISTDYTIYETADKVGIKDLRYFREQFKKVFNMNPSEYVKKFRSPFHDNYNLNKGIIDIKNK